VQKGVGTPFPLHYTPGFTAREGKSEWWKAISKPTSCATKLCYCNVFMKTTSCRIDIIDFPELQQNIYIKNTWVYFAG